MIQQIINERNEWNDRLERLLDRYDTRSQAAIVAMEKMAAEMHALRGRMQEYLVNIEARLRGGGGSK